MLADTKMEGQENRGESSCAKPDGRHIRRGPECCLPGILDLVYGLRVPSRLVMARHAFCKGCGGRRISGLPQKAGVQMILSAVLLQGALWVRCFHLIHTMNVV